VLLQVPKTKELLNTVIMANSLSQYALIKRPSTALILLSCIIISFGCSRNTNVIKKKIHEVSRAQLQDNPLLKGRALATNSHYVADLSGVHVQPDPVRTEANGKVFFHLNQDKTKLYYTIYLMKADSVTMIHVHEVNGQPIGPELVWLYPKGQHSPQLMPGPIDGQFVTGIITSQDLSGPLKDHSVEDLVRVMKDDSAYVIVHTTMHPKGELRGKVMNNLERWIPTKK